MSTSTNLIQSMEKYSPKQSHSTANSIQEKLHPSLLFDFDHSYRPNLYQKTSKYFLLDFSDTHFVVKAAIPLQRRPAVKVEYVDSIFESLGIVYSGFLKVDFQDSECQIKIPCEKSYDPVTDSAISYSQFAFILAFCSIEVEAALSGATEEGLEEIYQSLKDVIKYVIGKETLVEWMHVQIKVACFKKSQPPAYEEFAMTKVILGKLQLSKSRSKEFFEVWLDDSRCLTQKNFARDPFKLAKSGVMKSLSELTPGIFALDRRGMKLQDAKYTAKRLEYKLEKDGDCKLF